MKNSTRTPNGSSQRGRRGSLGIVMLVLDDVLEAYSAPKKKMTSNTMSSRIHAPPGS
jgi:hypothetical protein